MHKGPHHLLLIWLTFTGLFAFLITVAWNEGVLAVLFSSDRSKISYAITLLYVLVTIHCARRIYYISCQINDSREIENLIRTHPRLELNMQDDRVHLDRETVLPDCIVTSYIHDLLNRARSHEDETDNRLANNELIEVYESKLKGPHDVGWFSADAMIKMGLLGTIIGFILMLSSVANITDFDVTTMQKVLKQMSSGMGTALYTTLAGLTFSMLAAAQYQMLDRSVDELIETTKHLTQVYVLPKIR
ncbi:MAG TPA: MotA/TolQ/ExbB proton channel family protein [Gammaproteobacteria bacterium]|nr:MotA/TolQ/ExbB proton channel family protein [Gammaproteobacteria bacterium]